MLTIDGSIGEGGGQILRTALALSMITTIPCRIEKIRAKRAKPGLLRQHLTCVKAAEAISGAKTEGAELGSKTLTFQPRELTGGEHRFAIGSAGSTTLVAQTIMPALCFAPAPSRVMISGGTHNQSSPPFPFLDTAFLPLVRRIGFDVAATLNRPGYYPAGGGEIEIAVAPAATFKPLILDRPGSVTARLVEAVVANLAYEIAEREVATALGILKAKPEAGRALTDKRADGHGNVVTVTITREHVTEVFTGFGEKGLSAESVASRAAVEAVRYVEADVGVAEHLADQLLLPMALGAGGHFTTVQPSQHTLTNIAVIEKFLPVEITVESLSPKRFRISVSK